MKNIQLYNMVVDVPSTLDNLGITQAVMTNLEQTEFSNKETGEVVKTTVLSVICDTETVNKKDETVKDTMELKIKLENYSAVEIEKFKEFRFKQIDLSKIVNKITPYQDNSKNIKFSLKSVK